MRMTLNLGLVGLMALAVVGGCKKSEDSKTPAPAGTGETQTGQTGGKTAQTSYTIGLIAKSESNPVFKAARTGAYDAAKELGEKLGVKITIDWRTPNNEDAQQQATYIEQLTTAGVDGIAISCTDANLLTGAINDAVAGGVEVVCFDSDAPESDRFAYYGVDDVAAGREVAQQLVKVMGEKGVVAILAGNQAAPNLQNRVKGVQEVLAKHPDIKVLPVYYHAETAPDAAAKMQQVQTAKPDITGWALVGGWPLYTDNALDGIYEHAKIVSLDPLPLPLGYLKKGQVQVLIGQPYYGWGYESVRLLMDKLHDGKSPPQEMNYAKFDIVTQDNVDKYIGLWDKWLGKK